MILTVTLNAAIDKTYSVDNFAINNVYRTKKVTALPGGKGINVTRVLRTLGEEVLATGFVGGFSGKFILRELEKQNLVCDFQQVEEESRTCINILDNNGGTSTEVLENGVNITEKELRCFMEKFKMLSQKAKVVVMSGSIPNGVPIDIYKRLIHIANNNEAYTILDTSGPAFIEGLKGKPFMVKPNREEFEKAVGMKLDTEEDILNAVRKCMNEGIRLFTVSMGSGGSIIGYKNELYRVFPPRIDAVNPVGCGDSLVSGFALGLARDMSIEYTIKYATAVAASNALHYGAGMVSKPEVEELVKEVRVQKVYLDHNDNRV